MLGRGTVTEADLRRQLDQLLRPQPSWKLLPTTTPGAEPVWCYELRSDTELSVSVDGGAVVVRVAADGAVSRMGSVAELVEWLEVHRPGALVEVTDAPRPRRRWRSTFRWE